VEVRLGEEIPLKKTENRLPRQINNGDLTEFIGRKLTEEAKYWIKDETVLEEDPLNILEIYLTRWKCKDSFRFINQSYNLEDARVQSYIALRNTVSLVIAVFFFIIVILAAGLGLRILLKKVYKKAKRLFEIPPFKQYAICDGIYNLLWGQIFKL